MTDRVQLLADRASVVRSIGWVYLVAAATQSGLILLPGPELVSPAGAFATVTVTALCGLVMLRHADELPDWTPHAALAVGTVIQTALLATGIVDPGIGAIGYVWIALLAGYAVGTRALAAHVAAAMAAFGAFTLIAPPDAHLGEMWLAGATTIVLAGVLVALLRRRVEELVLGLADAGRSDVMTGLRNRRGFGETFEVEFERARRSAQPLALLVIDVDGLREVNDGHGHATGDAVLTRIAAILDDRRRRIDVPARISGEEFGVILPDTDEHGAYVLAERLRRSIRDGLADGPSAVTVSIGVAACPSHGASPPELLSACDHALAVAKRLGGDRSVIYNPQVSADLLACETRLEVQDEGHLAAVLVLAETLDMRDTGTARHSQTVGRYARLLAEELDLGEALIERIHLAGVLHDVGKVGVPDSILMKPGTLTEAEWDEMRRHPELGARILQGANLEDISGWVLAHHERPDGGGYPQGICGDEIPLPARILAVADAYEAMTAERAYKRAMTHAEAQAELLRCSGTQFDPHVVRAFVSVLRAERADASA